MLVYSNNYMNRKQNLFDGLAETAKGLGSGRRLEIIDLLAQGDRSVEEIATQIQKSVANTSHHLRLLARAGLVRSQRDGTHVIYALASESVGTLWVALRAVAIEQVAAVERLAGEYLGDRTGLQPLSRDDLLRRLRRRDVIVVDVRPSEEYRAGHVAAARSIPIGELEHRLRSLPKSREIVAYCRGPLCVYADDAVRLLRKKGYRARRLEDGWPEWRRAGLPVAFGDEQTG